MNIYDDAVGLKIILNVVIDITSASVMKIRYRRPSGLMGEWTAQKEDATHISYVLSTQEFNKEEGIWSFQAYVECGWKLAGDIVKLRIDQPIVVPVVPGP